MLRPGLAKVYGHTTTAMHNMSTLQTLQDGPLQLNTGVIKVLDEHASAACSTCMSSLRGSSPAVSIIILEVAALCSLEKLQTTGTISSRSAGALNVDTPSSDSEPDRDTQW